MLGNEEIIRERYAAAEGQGTAIERHVRMFSDGRYVRDVPSGKELRGKAVGDSIAGFVSEFPDVHRQLLSIYGAENIALVASWQEGIEAMRLATHESNDA
jgi:hypothetical protein